MSLPDLRSRKMKHGFLSTVLLSAALTGTAMAQQPIQEALRPGDVVRLQLVIPGDAGQGQDYSGDYMITEAGTVSLPLIGVIQAANVPSDQVRARIVEGYQSLFRNQALQVTLMRRISVLGAVRTPGIYHADPTMRIGDVIALAGGVGPNGKQNDVKIIRNGQEVSTDLTLVSSLPGELQSGDQIFVPERSFVSRNFPWLVGVTLGIVGIIVRGY